jgi:DNA-binding GntR family transcriptional regulator
LPPKKTALRESDKVEEELRRLILSLELEPGLAVSEAALISRFGWGRTPLREAFQRLAEQSLLQIIPHHGVVIMPLSLFDFIEVMDAMGVVIGPAAGMACSRMSAEELAQLEALLKRSQTLTAEDGFAALADLDYEFHRLLAQATGNRYLSRYLLHLHRVAERFNLAAWKRDQQTEPSLQEHRAIVAAFRQRDSEAARAAMLAHIENARQRVIGTIQKEA